MNLPSRLSVGALAFILSLGGSAAMAQEEPSQLQSSTAQVAPTILKALGLNPSILEAVRAEGTPVLPAVQF